MLASGRSFPATLPGSPGPLGLLKLPAHPKDPAPAWHAPIPSFTDSGQGAHHAQQSMAGHRGED